MGAKSSQREVSVWGPQTVLALVPRVSAIELTKGLRHRAGRRGPALVGCIAGGFIT